MQCINERIGGEGGVAGGGGDGDEGVMHANPRSVQKMCCCVQLVIVPSKQEASSEASGRNTERHVLSCGSLAAPHVQYCPEVMDEHAPLSLFPTHVRVVGSESKKGMRNEIV